jgi:hypothetical protein
LIDHILLKVKVAGDIPEEILQKIIEDIYIIHLDVFSVESEAMSTRGSILYKHPLYIYHEMNDGLVYLTLEDKTPEVLIPLCRAELYFKIKRCLTKRVPDALRSVAQFGRVIAAKRR